MTSYKQLKEECKLLRAQLEQKELELKKIKPQFETYVYPAIDYSPSDLLEKHYLRKMIPESVNTVTYFESKNTSLKDVETFRLIFETIYKKFAHESKFARHVSLGIDFAHYSINLFCFIENKEFDKPGLEFGTKLSDILSTIPAEIFQFNLIIFEDPQGVAYPA